MYQVYVVELEKAILDLPKWQRNVSQTSQRCVYVGSTGQTAQERFLRHKKGGLGGNNIVKRYGQSVTSKICCETREEAVKAEIELAQTYRDAGIGVWQR